MACDAIFYQGEVVQRLKGREDGSMVLVEKTRRDGDQNMYIYMCVCRIEKGICINMLSKTSINK